MKPVCRLLIAVEVQSAYAAAAWLLLKLVALAAQSGPALWKSPYVSSVSFRKINQKLTRAEVTTLAENSKSRRSRMNRTPQQEGSPVYLYQPIAGIAAEVL